MKNVLAAKEWIVSVVMIGFVFAGKCHAGVPVIDGGNLLQNIVTAMEGVAQTAKQIDEYQTQLEQYQIQLQNTLQPASSIWSDAQTTMSNLVVAVDTLSYYKSQLGSLNAYLEKFEDLDFYKNSPCYTSAGCSAAAQFNLEAAREFRSQAQKRANDAHIRGIEQQQQSLTADAKTLADLQAAATTASGQLEAISYANQFASEQTNQLIQIRGLLVSQHNAIVVRAAAELDAQAQSRARADQMRTWKFQASPADNF